MASTRARAWVDSYSRHLLHFTGLAGVLLVAAAVRMWKLRDLPIFGDEAIFLRIADLVRTSRPLNLWRSLQEAAAPFHTWLLALAFPLSDDPVRAGRVVSVLAGLLTVPAVGLLVVVVVESLRGRGDFRFRSRSATFLVGCSLAALSPFLVFTSRVARVDAIFLLETVLAALLAISLAIRVRARFPWTSVLGFGLLMGITMLTRQAVSYVLWLLPIAAFVLLAKDRSPSAQGLMRLTSAVALAAFVSLLIWVPMLLVPARLDLMTRLFHLGTTRPHLSGSARVELLAHNATVCVESLWLYLTPPVVLAAIGGIVALIRARRWGAVLFLASWEALLIGPTVLAAGDYFPRYSLPAAIPVLVTAAIGAELVLGTMRRHRPRRSCAVVAGVVCALLLSWGVRDITRGVTSWQKCAIHPLDRAQYVSGWAAGLGTEEAVRYLRVAAAQRPAAVLTPEFSGNPSDSVWLLLKGEADIRLFYAVDALRKPLLSPVEGAKGLFWLAGDVRDDARLAPVQLYPEESVFLVSMDPVLTDRGWLPALSRFGSLNPELREVARFRNPSLPTDVTTSSVVVLRFL